MDFKFAGGIYLLFPCNTLYMLNIYIYLCLFWHKKSRPAKHPLVTINSSFKKSSLAKFFMNCYLSLSHCPYAPSAESASSKHPSVPHWDTYFFHGSWCSTAGTGRCLATTCTARADHGVIFKEQWNYILKTIGKTIWWGWVRTDIFLP